MRRLLSDSHSYYYLCLVLLMPSFFFHLTLDFLDKPNISQRTETVKPHTSGNRPATRFVQQTWSPNNISLTSIGSISAGVPGSQPESNGNLETFQGHGLKELSDTHPTKDWRVSKIFLQSITMLPATNSSNHHKDSSISSHITNGIGAGPSGLATKGRYEPTDVEENELGWGVVRLYRDSKETPGLYDVVSTSKHLKHGKGRPNEGSLGQDPLFRDEDCTTLCILAVPSYLTPSDFLGFVGEQTREEVSHFRMIRTERVNRYMVLMKFRNGRKAREWRKEWNGKVFNSMEVRTAGLRKYICTC